MADKKFTDYQSDLPLLYNSDLFKYIPDAYQLSDYFTDKLSSGNSYSDFLDLANSLNIPLNNDVSNIAPSISGDNKNINVSDFEPEENNFLSPEAAADLENLIGNIFPKTEAAKKIRIGKSDAADYEAKQKSMEKVNEYLAGIAALEKAIAMGEADAADYLAKQESFNKVKKSSTDKNKDMEIAMKTPPSKAEKEAAQKRIDEASKQETSEEEDGRPKGLKDYLAKFLEDGDALIALGSAIARGEGLVGGIEDYSKAVKQTKAEKAAAEKEQAEAEIKALEAAANITYKGALAQQAIAYAEKAGLPTATIQNAEMNAFTKALATGAAPGSEEYNKAWLAGFSEIMSTAKQNTPDVKDIILASELKDKYPELQQFLEGAGTSAVTPEGSDGANISLPYNEYLKMLQTNQ